MINKLLFIYRERTKTMATTQKTHSITNGDVRRENGEEEEEKMSDWPLQGPTRVAQVTEHQQFEIMMFYITEPSMEEERAYLNTVFGKDFVDKCVAERAQVVLEIIKEDAEA